MLHRSLVSAGIGLLLAASAGATPVQSETPIAGAAVAVTFDEIVLPDTTILTDQYAALGFTLSPGILYNPGTANMSDDILGFQGRRLANFYPVTSVFSIYFTSPVSQAVVGILAPDVATFTALLGGVEVEFFQNTRPVQAQGYYGFRDIVFDEIRIDAHSSVDQGYALLDNFQFTPVPEPSAAASIALGLAALALGRRGARAE